MINLLQETHQILNDNGVSMVDVQFVLSRDSQMGTWNDFVALANIEYDNGYGGHMISSQLYIVGDGWWLERGEYDGSEWWEFKTQPKELKEHSPLTHVRS